MKKNTFLPFAAILLTLPAQPPSYEVATVKPADPNAIHKGLMIPRDTNRITVTAMPMKFLIQFAYGQESAREGDRRRPRRTAQRKLEPQDC